MEDKTQSYIPENRSGMQRLFGIPYPNLIEAFVFLLIWTIIVILLPFITEAKIKLWLIGGASLVIVSLIGFKNKSLIQAFILYLKYKKKKRSLKLGSVADGKNRLKSKTEHTEQREENDDSIIGKIKYKFIEAYQALTR